MECFVLEGTLLPLSSSQYCVTRLLCCFSSISQYTCMQINNSSHFFCFAHVSFWFTMCWSYENGLCFTTFRKWGMKTVLLWILVSGDFNSRSLVGLQVVEYCEGRWLHSLLAPKEYLLESVCLFWNPNGGKPWYTILVQLIALGVEDFLLFNWLGMISDVRNILTYGTYQKGRVSLRAQGTKQQVISHSAHACPKINHVMLWNKVTGSLASISMIRLASKNLCQSGCHLLWLCDSVVNLLLHTAGKRRWQGLSIICLASKLLW